MPIAGDTTHCLYDITFDNVNQKVHVRHHGRAKSNNILNMVQTFATRDRIPCTHLDDKLPPAQVIENIPLEAFLPFDEVRTLFKEEMSVAVERILKCRTKCFRDADVVQHIPQQYQKEPAQKATL